MAENNVNKDKNLEEKAKETFEEAKDFITPKTVEEKKHEDSLTFDTSVVEKIAALAAREIKGILDLKGGLLSGFTENFGAYDVTKGVDAEVGEKEVIINLKLILEFGQSAPRIFDDLKQYIGQQLKQMTGLTLVELNVDVVDVMTRKDFDQSKNKSLPNQYS
ncbi:MAG: Asp23/Gls24 family envelope stress response protein [Tissierellia bacterium]|nr:Asp23/Gls24 family envelope stress response protein [Tissierellia bacterium]